MFLFLFSDFYKAKYTNARARSAAAKANTNGYTKIPASNGKCIPVSNGDLSNHLVASNNNKGACMPVMDDEAEIIKPNGHYTNGYKNGYANGHAFKEGDGMLSTNDAILNPDSSSSSLHQRKVK